MRRVLVTVLLLGLLAVPLAAGVIPRDSTVHVSDENQQLGMVQASMLKAKVPVRLIAYPEKADYVLRGNYLEGSAWLELISAEGEIVWAERLTQRFATAFSRGASRTLVDRLKKAILKR